MPSIPGAYLVTLRSPSEYTPHQLELACLVAAALHRGRFVLTEKPGM